MERDVKFKLFEEKMAAGGLDPRVIQAFAHYYQQVAAGATGRIPEDQIDPIGVDEIPSLADLSTFREAGRKLLQHSAMVVLNGGLGTSMGLTGPKSLLPVKNRRTFLEIILEQTRQRKVTLALMNSFNTQAATRSALERLGPQPAPHLFTQNKFPKILQSDLTPATWPANPELEWNPPGHGDVYGALMISGLLGRFEEAGIRYALIANADNLGATLDSALLGYFAENQLPFMMEVARRTPTDVKGGHLARHREGHLLLRESAQCPAEDQAKFEDIDHHPFFNTNNIWIDLKALELRIRNGNVLALPMIVNPKTLDPRDPESPPVYQLETAMGAAISLFPGAAAVQVPRRRFLPVKKCSDLLAIRSDCYQFGEQGELMPNPARRLPPPRVTLDPDYYGRIDRFDARFAQGAPSLLACEALAVEGDVAFGREVTLKGGITIRNSAKRQAKIPDGAVIEQDLAL